MSRTENTRTLPGGYARHYSPMNTAHKNLKFIVGDLSANAFAAQTGMSQSTISRGLRNEDWNPDRDTAQRIADAAKVTLDEFLFSDLAARASSDPEATVRPLKGGVVHIRKLDGFSLPSGGLLERHDAFDHLEVKEPWFRFHVGMDPKNVRFAVQRDDSMTGEIEIGDVVLFDTAATDVVAEGEGIYAFTYFGVNHIKHIQIPRKGVILFSGTKRSQNSILVEGKELEGLKMLGRAVTAFTVKRL